MFDDIRHGHAVDRMSMTHSLECRAPFTDPKIVEFAAAIPANLKLKGLTLKHILRQVASRYVPREVVQRPKQGFGFPLGAWMRRDVRNLLAYLTEESRFVQRGLFSRDYMQELVNQHITGQVEHSYRLWILVNLEIWHRIFLENRSIDSVREEVNRMAYKMSVSP